MPGLLPSQLDSWGIRAGREVAGGWGGRMEDMGSRTLDLSWEEAEELGMVLYTSH